MGRSEISKIATAKDLNGKRRKGRPNIKCLNGTRATVTVRANWKRRPGIGDGV